MKPLIKILLCSFMSMLLASAILGGIISGPKGIFAAPILMIFGWFYFPVVFGLNAIAYDCWERFFSKRPFGRIYFILIGTVIAAALFSLIGIKEQGRELLYAIGYAVGASIAAAASCLWFSRGKT